MSQSPSPRSRSGRRHRTRFPSSRSLVAKSARRGRRESAFSKGRSSSPARPDRFRAIPCRKREERSTKRAPRRSKSYSSTFFPPISSDRSCLAFERRRAMRMEALDRLEAPGLSLLALGFAPADRLPIRRQDQSSAGTGDFDAVAARLIDIEEKGLLHRMFVRAGLDEDAGFEENVGGAQDFLAAVERESDVMKAAADAMRFERVSEIVALVGASQPHAGFDAAIEHDLLGQAEAERLFEKFAIGADVLGEAVEVVDPADIDAARRKALRLVLQSRPQRLGRLVPFGFVVELQQMPVGIAELVGRTMAEFIVAPAYAETRALESGDAPRQSRRAAGAESGVAETGGFRAGQLERIGFVIVPAAQEDRFALAAAFGHAEDIDEKGEARLRLGRQQLDMPEMGDIHDRLVLH